jgi:hypothetical protein
MSSRGIYETTSSRGNTLSKHNEFQNMANVMTHAVGVSMPMESTTVRIIVDIQRKATYGDSGS